MFTEDDMINAPDLEQLFRKAVGGELKPTVYNKRILKSIRNFCPVYTYEIDNFIEDKEVFSELEKYGRWSLVNYIIEKQKRV